MKTTVFLLLLAAVASAAPAEEEVDRLSARVLSLLDAEAPRDRAWGAYLAGKHGIDAAVPRLVDLLAHLPEADAAGPLGRAALDALIRLGAEPDLDLLGDLALRYPDPVLILLSTRDEAAAPALRPLLERREGVLPLTRRAVLALGTRWRMPGTAAELLRGFEIRARVDVFAAGPNVGGFARGSSGGCGCGLRELPRDRPGWPPAVRWVLTDWPAPGRTLFVAEPVALYWFRVEVERGTGIGVDRPGPRVDIDEFRLRGLAWLAGIPLATLGLEHRPSRLVFYESDEQYVREVDGWLVDLRRRRHRLMTDLLRRQAITEDEAKDLVPPIGLEVHDRRGRGDPLPEIDAAPPPPLTLPRVDASGPDPAEIEGPIVPVEVRADGTTLCEGEEQDAESLKQILLPIANASRDGSSELRPSRAAILVRADGRARIRDLLPIFRASGDADVRMYRILFAVRSADGGEGTVDWPPAYPAPLGRTYRWPSVELATSGSPVPVSAVVEYVRRESLTGLDLLLAEEIPLEFVLRTLEALRGVGVTDLAVFGGGFRHAGGTGSVSADRVPIYVNDLPLDEHGGLTDRDSLWAAGAPPAPIRTALASLPDPPGPLALLAFLEAGETHKFGPHRDVVKEGLRLLKQHQGPDGLFPDDHGKATLAMTRAYEQTNSPLFKQSAQQGLDRLAKREDPDAAPGADWVAAAFLAGKRAGLRVAGTKVEWANARLGTPPGDPPASADPADWLPGLLRAVHAGGDLASRWRRAVEERFTAAPAADASPALRAYLLALAWRSGAGG